MSTDLALVELIRRALQEDLGGVGDITTQATVPVDAVGTAYVVARQQGVLSGSRCVDTAFDLVDPQLQVEWSAKDGAEVAPGQVVATVRGSACSILTGERVGLNLLSHLSGIATRTAGLVRLLDGTGARIADTRKTTPGLRALQKQAVRNGGGINHRFGLFDAILVKDNHIGLGGGLTQVLRRLAEHAGHLTRVEIEVDDLDQLRQVLAFDAARLRSGHAPVVHAVLLDNMGPDLIAEGAALIRDHPAPVTVEVSGGVTEESVRALAQAGADVISVGALTHSVTELDFGLDLHES
ncbi:carboxylating nicotinate-nucleotide diphosphorylase [Allobranchiibius sp. GilTou73]|uniref:carboxylating nicotinate-nucleotide diphosphorylase n=1 Tax=Allobranchiibius sp. GilTou73 TaxID=2904523 RepID=UPI001F1B78CD|nr:carboxylating nicotinate-nucleotide diphosphorylase [Allobranchiibius sp. GilTou73]UIJ34366.1 carboxylating nicotinate-nucleotide diphosphorylase [Allobranchiibius sp. GilTou73]